MELTKPIAFAVAHPLPVGLRSLAAGGGAGLAGVVVSLAARLALARRLDRGDPRLALQPRFNPAPPDRGRSVAADGAGRAWVDGGLASGAALAHAADCQPGL